MYSFKAVKRICAVRAGLNGYKRGASEELPFFFNCCMFVIGTGEDKNILFFE